MERAKRRILICGFEPFPGVPKNPSAQVARRLAGLARPALADTERHVEILPTRWAALDRAEARIHALKPDVILLLGVASRRRVVCVESRAVNAAGSFPDASGAAMTSRKLSEGPAEIRSRADLPRLLAALRTAGLPAALSRDAGRYLCNGLYYRVLALTAGRDVPVVFIHLPGGPGTRGRAWEDRLVYGFGEGLVAVSGRLSARGGAAWGE
ncbi:pyroglutamyl-peptidase I [Roseixanthobacter glucoisosaccharinicivorans]|uniref:pyroglutamyl-peptidase I family protein n=1 Tax=Roseixanthobacter glucoisosaccharinicivorans TaxID=3119923 RepID=UPI0037296B1E